MIDLARVQARRDRVLREKLAADAGVQLALKKVEEQTSGFGAFSRRRLLTGALRLTRAMAPDVADALSVCREALGWDEPLEVYVKPDPMYGAFCMKPPTGPMILGLTSRLVEGMTAGELRFVVGHELAHCAFRHFDLPMPAVAAVEDLAGPIVSRPIAIELYLWCRSAEITADRAGLVCTRDLDAAASAFFKLSSGLSTSRVHSDVSAYLAQVDALGAAPSARQKPRDDDDTLECFATHPYAPLRLRALAAYARSDAYEQALGRGGLGTRLKIDEAEEIVERDLELMEPSYLEEKSDQAERMRRVLYLSGVVVAAANGTVHETEMKALQTLLGTEALYGEVKPAACRVELDEKLPAARAEASFVQRTQLVQHLTIVAAADGNVDAAELDAMYAIADRLGVPPVVVDHTLAASARPMD